MLTLMKKYKAINMLTVPDSKKMQLIWAIKRQMQQEALEEKLTRVLLNTNVNRDYPEGISITFKDLMQRAIEELKQRE